MRGVCCCCWWAAGCFWEAVPPGADQGDGRGNGAARVHCKDDDGGDRVSTRSQAQPFDFIAREDRHRAGCAIDASPSARVTRRSPGPGRRRAARCSVGMDATPPSPRPRLPVPPSPHSRSGAPDPTSEVAADRSLRCRADSRFRRTRCGHTPRRTIALSGGAVASQLLGRERIRSSAENPLSALCRFFRRMTAEGCAGPKAGLSAVQSASASRQNRPSR
jgi:hypothetical protein